MKLAERMVDGLGGSWKPDAYKDQYAANLSAIIAAKIKGKGAKPRRTRPAPASRIARSLT